MNIQKIIHSGQSFRCCNLTVNDVPCAAVHQDVSAVDFKMLMPTINWPSFSSQDDPDFVESYGKALQQSADLAREWAQDTGKDYKEVLPQ